MRLILQKKSLKVITLFIMAGMMLFSSLAQIQAATQIRNPRIKKNTVMDAGQKVTYDCVYFGSYPQSEVVASLENLSIRERYQNGSDYIVDASLYRKLKKSKRWNSNGELVIAGNKYRRIRKKDATFVAPAFQNAKGEYFRWVNTYHYFKYEPIKWRVLKITDDELFLLSDLALDAQPYHTKREDVRWESSTIRSWLNGYDGDHNQQGVNYKSKSFEGTAFSRKQYETVLQSEVKNVEHLLPEGYGEEGETIDGGNDTIDKVFLLSLQELYGDSAKKYGFTSSEDIYDEARRSKSSSYAKAMGLRSVAYDNIASGNYGSGYCAWTLRDPGDVGDAVSVSSGSGQVDYSGVMVSAAIGIRPAIRINLEKTHFYQYAGTVCTNGKVVIQR